MTPAASIIRLSEIIHQMATLSFFTEKSLLNKQQIHKQAGRNRPKNAAHRIHTPAQFLSFLR